MNRKTLALSALLLCLTLVSGCAWCPFWCRWPFACCNDCGACCDDCPPVQSFDIPAPVTATPGCGSCTSQVRVYDGPVLPQPTLIQPSSVTNGQPKQGTESGTMPRATPTPYTP